MVGAVPSQNNRWSSMGKKKRRGANRTVPPSLIGGASHPRHHGAMESAYALAFLFLQTENLWATGRTIDFSTHGFLEGVAVLLACSFITFQMLRVYYVIHQFEHDLALAGTNHFLEVLGDSSDTELRLRSVLAVLLVSAAKVLAPSMRSLLLFTTIALLCCFIVLILWDRCVWKGFDRTTPEPKVWNSMMDFFYLQERGDLGQPYFKTMKFWERASGFLAALLSVGYAYFRIPLVLGFVGAAVCAFFIMWGMGSRSRRRRAPASLPFQKELAAVIISPARTTVDQFLGGGNHSKRDFLAAVLLLGIIGLAGCVSGKHENASDAPGSPAATATPIRIATSKNLWCTLTLVANDRGFFEAEHLLPTIAFQAAGRLNMDALLGGSADVANVVETNVAYQSLNGATDLAVNSAIVSARDYAILTRKDAGIRVPADLKGKSLAYSQATGAESFVFWLLEKHGLTAADIKVVPLQPAGLVDSFVSQRHGAVAAWEPFVSTIRSRPIALGPTFDGGKDGFAGLMLVATRKSWATEHREALSAYDRAMKQASDFVAMNPRESQEIVARETGIPLERVTEIWGRFDFTYRPSGPSDVQLVSEVVERIRRNVKGMDAKTAVPPSVYFAGSKSIAKD